jgi:hypothetical protein
MHFSPRVMAFFLAVGLEVVEGRGEPGEER